MLKRFISVLLCIVLATAAFTLTAYGANKTDTLSGDVKLYLDKETVAVGDIVTVTIYLENITVPTGVIAVDFPLSYDKTKLNFIKYDCIFPEEWDGYGEFFGHATPDEEPWYLRSLPDADDIATNEAYRIKDDKKIGFTVTFKTLSKGEAYIAVEDVGNNKIMLAAIEGDQVNNYGANGMTLKFNIGDAGSSDTSGDEPSTAPDISTPVDTSADVSVDTSVDSSEEQSGEVSAPESTDISEESTTTPDQSTEGSVVVEDSSADVGESSADSSEESSTAATDDGKDNGGSLSKFLIPALIVVAVAAAVGVGAVVYTKRSSKKAEDE